MSRYDPERPSIFSRPDEDLDATAPHSSGPQSPGWRSSGEPRAQPPMNRPTPSRPAVETVAEPTKLSRQVIVLGSMGLAILALGGFIAASLLRGSPEPGLAGASAAASPTIVSTMSAEPVASATATSTAVPTPEPTPAGPPVELAVGGWATVVTTELNVRDAAGVEAKRVYGLVRGAVVAVAEGPNLIDGANWYRVASLGGASGWATSGPEVAPFLESIAGDPRLSECGQVRGQVLELATGSVTAREVIRIGDYALPGNAFGDAAIGAIELLRGMGDEACFTAVLGANGIPELSTELNVNACGQAVAAAGTYQLEPTDDGDLPLASQVLDPTVVHPALLDGGPADHRMASNLRTVVSMMANDGVGGCVSASVTQRGDAQDVHRSASVRQCSIVELYDQYSLKLAPAAGGPTAWIKLPGDYFDPNQFSAGTPMMISVDVSASDTSHWAGAWPQGEC